MNTLLTGLGMGESPRWHDGRLWLSDMAANEVVRADLDGKREVVAGVPGMPMGLGWLPDGRFLVVSCNEGKLLRQEPDGSLVPHADLAALSPFPWGDMVVDGRGNAYVAPDGATLILAETYGHRLTAFDIEADGGLANRRVWAELPGAFPDGICLDADGAVWYADVPGQRCVRVREGGEVLQTESFDQGAFACVLGGPEGTTLFVTTASWPPPQDGSRGGRVVTIEAPARAVGYP